MARKRTAAALARRNRQRGSEGERELAAILSDALGYVVQRRLGQERDSGGDLHVGRYSIECKRRKRIAGLYDWMAQSQAAADRVNKVPVVAVRADSKEWLLCFRVVDAIRLLREAING